MRIQASSQPPRTARYGLSLEPTRQRLVMPDGDALSFPLDGSSFFLGGDENCLVQWEGAEPKQTEVRWKEGTLWARGEKTWVNGEPSPDWTALGDGGRVQLGDTEQPELRLALLREQNPQTSKQTLAVTYYGDASVPNIAQGVSNQPPRLSELLADGKAPVQVQGVLARGGRLNHLAQAALPVALGAAALGGLGLGVAGLIHGTNLPLLMAGAITALSGGVGVCSTWSQGAGHWKAATAQFEPTGFPTERVSVNVVPSAPGHEQFDQAWKTSLRSWPQARQIIFLSGHGFQDRAAGLSFQQLARTVQGAEAIVLDTCNGGQVEALLTLADSAKVAVCSEHKVRSSGFPLEAMLGKAEFPQEPKDLASSLVQSAVQKMPAKSLVAVDLQALKQKLLPSLEKLAQQLLVADKSQVQAVLEASQRTDTSGGHTFDLGSFLAELPAGPEVQVTKQALNETILAMAGQGTLSFDLRSPEQMPEAWRNLMNRLRR